MKSLKALMLILGMSLSFMAFAQVKTIPVKLKTLPENPFLMPPLKARAKEAVYLRELMVRSASAQHRET
jgi:hypothetical protein